MAKEIYLNANSNVKLQKQLLYYWPKRKKLWQKILIKLFTMAADTAVK